MRPISWTKLVHRGLVAGVVGCFLLATPQVARAQSTAANAAAAEALFEEGKRLVAQHKYPAAIEKFKESNRLDRGAGTLLHLADCYERNKQLASAWATYREAASAAQLIGQAKWEKKANDRANRLEPKLARLTIRVESPATKIEVKRDGATITAATWGSAIPVDTGSHVVDATAPGHKPFHRSIDVPKDGTSVELVVPKLDVDPNAAVATTDKPKDATTTLTSTPGASPWERARAGNTQRTIGLIVGGVGVAGLAVGGVTGLIALNNFNTSGRECPNDGSCTSRAGVDAYGRYETFGNVSTIAFVAGGVAVAAGAVLYFTAPTINTRVGSIRVAPTGGPNSAGVLMGGVF